MADHRKALDALRRYLLAQLRENRWEMQCDSDDFGRTETWYACRHICVETISEIRALDAVLAVAEAARALIASDYGALDGCRELRAAVERYEGVGDGSRGGSGGG